MPVLEPNQLPEDVKVTLRHLTARKVRLGTWENFSPSYGIPGSQNVEAAVQVMWISDLGLLYASIGFANTTVYQIKEAFQPDDLWAAEQVTDYSEAVARSVTFALKMVDRLTEKLKPLEASLQVEWEQPPPETGRNNRGRLVLLPEPKYV